MCHKRSVVSILLRRAQNIPSTQKGKREETKRIKAVLRDNNYPSSFINSCERSLSKLPTDLQSIGFVVLLYVQGISESISRILRQQQIKVAFKPLRNVNSLFPRPKAREKVDRPQSGTVHKISCTNWTYQWKLGLQKTKGVFLCSTMTLRSPAMSTNTTTKGILELSDLLDKRLAFTSDPSW